MQTIVIEIQRIKNEIEENGASTIFKFVARDVRNGAILNFGNSVDELIDWLSNQK